jgi:hypothetical protein
MDTRDVDMGELGVGMEGTTGPPAAETPTHLPATQQPYTQPSTGSENPNAVFNLRALGLEATLLPPIPRGLTQALPHGLQPYTQASPGSQNPDATFNLDMTGHDGVAPVADRGFIMSPVLQPYTQVAADSQNPSAPVNPQKLGLGEIQPAGGTRTPDLSPAPDTQQACIMLVGAGSQNADPLLSQQPYTQVTWTQASAGSQNPIPANIAAEALQPAMATQGLGEPLESQEGTVGAVPGDVQGPRGDTVQLEGAQGSVGEAPRAAGSGVLLHIMS